MPHAFRTLKRCKSVDFAFSGYFAILRHWTPVSSSLCINSWYQINSISGQRISKPLTNLPAIWELGESPNLALAIWSSGSSKAKRRWSGPPTIYQHLRWTVSVTLEKTCFPNLSCQQLVFVFLCYNGVWKQNTEKSAPKKRTYQNTTLVSLLLTNALSRTRHNHHNHPYLVSWSQEQPQPHPGRSQMYNAIICNHMQSMQK